MEAGAVLCRDLHRGGDTLRMAHQDEGVLQMLELLIPILPVSYNSVLCISFLSTVTSNYGQVNRSRPPILPPQKSPGEPGFGDSPFPTFPGQHRKTNLDKEQQILSDMGALDIDNKKKGPKGRAPTRGASIDDYGPRPSMDSQRGPPPPRNYPPQGYPEQRRGPPPGRGGYGDYPEPGFGPPSRTMTMPSNIGGMQEMAPPPHRSDSAPYGPTGRGMPMARPSTASGHRPPPQRMPPPNQQGAGYGGQGYDYGPDQGYGYDDYYNDYYDEQGANGYQPPPPAEPDMPNFDAAPRGRNSLDLSMQSGAPEPQRGPGRMPGLSTAKSQPDLRQPQQAVFEMAQDVPPMPPPGGQGGYGARMNGPSPPQGGFGLPSNPQGGFGLPSNPMPVRAGHQQTPPNANPDTLPSHPLPVRAGHMQGALVNNKPPPVRNYGGTPTPAPGPTPSPVPTQGSAAPRAPSQAEPPVTTEELERLRNTVKVNPQDQATALRLAKRLMQAADVLVPNVADPKSRHRARERYVMDAQKILKKLSNAGNSDAMFTLADGLGKGFFGSEPDNKEAFTMYQSAAKLGHAAAAYRTAVCCEIGNEEGGGTRKDPLKAIQWYKRAAMLGDTPAMYKVGMILLKGLLGQQKNPRESIGWLKRAAESADSENPHALHELGLLYESAGPNDVILRDEPYAFRLFKQAADLGYKFSQYRLGCAYEYGLLGCPIDPRLSIMWYSKAAEQGEHQSELALSGWYLTGSDNVLGQNDTEAYLWARKAAMAGLAKAEYAMGYFTEMGIGIPANMEDAKRWYWRAAGKFHSLCCGIVPHV